MTDDVFQRVLKLTNDLAVQQQSNQALASGIKSQLVELKQRTANSALERGKLGDVKGIYLEYYLKTFAKEQSSTATGEQLLLKAEDFSEDSIQAKYANLLKEHEEVLQENRQLEIHCKDLQKLVKEYEVALEHVATKLRDHTISSSEGHVQLRREFEALLDAEKSTTAELMIENITLRQHLHRLGALLREAYNQDDTDNYTTQLAQLAMENQGLRDALKISTVALDPLPPSAKCDKPEAVKSYSQSGVVEEFFTDK